jgi:lipopolysaccharide heptosyltransferase III
VEKTGRVLIYRLGSLGDTIVALPCYHLVARAFFGAERRVLTNFPISSRAAPVSAVLGGSGLVHGYIGYPRGVRDPRVLIGLRSTIRAWRPDVLIYLNPADRLTRVLRDVLFFKSCGIPSLVGVPFAATLRRHRWISDGMYYEHEAERLARCLSALGDARLADPASWDLRLTAAERAKGERVLSVWRGSGHFIACAVGTKRQANDWGTENWAVLLERLSQIHPKCGLVLIGAKEERGLAQSASRNWRGPALNLCGELTVRESAAVMEHAALFLGHDSGPMHVAAAVGVACVAVFSARNEPRIWFPHGAKHRVIYHRTSCHGCGLEVCTEHRKQCISSITPDEVLSAVREVLPARPARAAVGIINGEPRTISNT